MFGGGRLLHFEGWPYTEFSFDSFVFPFLSTLKMLSHCVLASIVSDKKSAVNIIEDSLYVMSHYSHYAFKILLSSLTFNSLIIICLSMDFLVFILLGFHLASWKNRYMSLIKSGIFSVIISSDILSSPFFFSSFWDCDYVTVDSLMISHKS